MRLFLCLANERLWVEESVAEEEFDMAFLSASFVDGHALGFRADDEPDTELGSTVASGSSGTEIAYTFGKNCWEDPIDFVPVPYASLVTMSGPTKPLRSTASLRCRGGDQPNLQKG